MRRLSALAILALISFQALCQSPETRRFARRDTADLFMDLYRPAGEPRACVVYIFGGGFMDGVRNDTAMVPYFQDLRGRGYLVAAIDYRLGLKGKQIHSLSIRPVEEAIGLAVEDLCSAVAYLVENRDELRVDTSRIVLVGSSAGAITALQADYARSRGMAMAAALPAGFRFAGVVSFSGAIFSREGRVNYPLPPAPTLMLHGTADKLVPYNKIQVLSIGMFGSNALAKRFRKFGFPYAIRRFEGSGHEIAALMRREIDLTARFVDEAVAGAFRRQVDARIVDSSIERPEWGRARPSQLHKF